MYRSPNDMQTAGLQTRFHQIFGYFAITWVLNYGVCWIEYVFINGVKHRKVPAVLLWCNDWMRTMSGPTRIC